MQRHCWSFRSSTIITVDADADAALDRIFWNGSTDGAAVDNCVRRHCWSCSSSTIIVVHADVDATIYRFFDTVVLKVLQLLLAYAAITGAVEAAQ